VRTKYSINLLTSLHHDSETASDKREKASVSRLSFSDPHHNTSCEKEKIMADKLLTLLFASVFVFTLSTVVFAPKAGAQDKGAKKTRPR